MEYLLGIDNGGTMVKAAIYTTAGDEVAVSSERTQMIFPSPGHTERDMAELWAANCRAISSVIAAAGINPQTIKGVAVTGHGNGMYLVDGDGNATWNGIVSTDSRAERYVQEWSSSGVGQRALSRSRQSMWAAQPPALLRWFKEHHPGVLDQTRWILMCKDFVRFRLTGEARAEITDYSGTNTVNVYNGEYDPELFSIYGIEWAMDKMPPLVGSGEIAGHVTEQAASQTGLLGGTPVAGGLFDITACAIGSGVLDSTQLCIIAGTWSINEYVADAPVLSPDLFMNSIYCVPGKTLVTEASPTSASNLEWFINSFLQTETDRARLFDRINTDVASITPEKSDLVFLPYLFGSNVASGASGTLLGMHGWHSQAHILRSIYEGVVFSHRLHIDKLLSHRDMPLSARIAGGAAHSDTWLQMFADVLQVAIEVPETEELGAMGAAMCAGMATGAFESFDSAVASMVKVRTRVEPQQNYAEVYQRKYRRFKDAIGALESFWSVD